MSDLFDEEPERPAPERSARRARALVVTGAVLVVGFFLLTAFASVYTDRLWFKEVGYTQVFSTLLLTKVGLFLVFGGVMGGVVALNMYLAYRYRPIFRMSGGDPSVERYRDAVTPVRGWLLAGVGLVVALFAGTSAIGQWRSFLLWKDATDFGREDAYFGKDVGFFVFRLPWWNFLVDYLMALAVVALLATAVVHYLFGGIRLQQTHDRLSGAAQVQFSVLLGAFVLAKAVDYFLDRYDLVTDDHRLFTGMNNTGENALLPARNILVGIALVCAVLFFLNVWRRTWQLPSVGLALLALSAVLLGMIWPAIVQNFQVKPSEADKERTYIKANIDATRDAYGLSDIETESYQGIPPGSTTQAQATTVLGQLTTTPVVDPQQVGETFQQRQALRAYYSFPTVLDVDRYKIGGQEVPLVLGVRELDQTGINPSDQNWSNLHTVYTHGEGLVAAYANRISPSEVNGRIVWAEGVQTDDGTGGNALTAQGNVESRIYFGERSPSYSIVGKPSAGADNVELGLADTDSDEGDQRTTYDGKGGVPIGSTFNQLMYAIKFGEPNFLLSGRVNGNSKVLYDRTPVERIEKVAPWLTVDSDPYPAVVDGRVLWIVDGYTTTDRFPNAQRESFSAMTDDSLQQNVGLQTIPTDEINYMRSAVKATVDAYDGTVTLYQWDQGDPILQTWMKAFPDSVKPKGAIPEELLEHLRYPEDLFKVQRFQLAKYHVTDPGDFYSGNNRWEVPEDPNNTARQVFQPPYRLFSTGVDGTNDWSLTSVFVPRGKGTLAAYLQVNSDATAVNQFGKLRLLEVNDQNTPGPGQVANQMQQEDAVSAALQQYRVNGATPPRFGNLLTLPVDGGLIYIQPVYAVRTAGASSFPILQFVIVKYGESVGIDRTLPAALGKALGVDLGDGATDPGTTPTDPGTTPTDPGTTPTPTPTPEPTGTIEEQIAAALRQADDAFKAADAAQAKNDTVTWAQELEKAQAAIQEAVRLADQRDNR